LFTYAVVANEPVNVRPKTSSSGGTSFFGFAVFVIDNLDASMSCNFTVEVASGVML
jgi:hypothetical protein